MAALILFAAPNAVAQTPGGAARDFPAKRITIVVPFAPAGAGDLFARTVAQHLQKAWGREVIVENRSGAGGGIGLGYAAKAPADGYNLALGNLGTLAINPSLYKKLPYDPVKSFDPVSLVGGTPLILVTHPSLPVKSVKELIVFGKNRPGELNYASAGTGGPTHLAMEIIKSKAGLNIVHIPYRGNQAAITAVISGEAHMMVTTILTPLPHMKTGRLRGIAVTTSRRQPAVPDIPTMAEAGLPGIDVSGWYGILATAGTPPEIIAKLNAEIVRMIRLREVTDPFLKQGLEIFSSTPKEFADKINTETVKWGKVVRDTNATVN